MRTHSGHDDAIDRGHRLRLGAKGLAVRDGAILLVKERHADGTPFWTLPGGGLKPDETATEALRRELREEVRCHGQIGEPIDRFVYAHQSMSTATVYRVFECSLTGAIDPAITTGVIEYQWCTPSTMPAETVPQIRSIGIDYLGD